MENESYLFRNITGMEEILILWIVDFIVFDASYLFVLWKSFLLLTLTIYVGIIVDVLESLL